MRGRAEVTEGRSRSLDKVEVSGGLGGQWKGERSVGGGEVSGDMRQWEGRERSMGEAEVSGRM